MTATALAAETLLPAGAPRLGLGCGDLYAGEALNASIRLVDAALEAGVRWFDVARLYGNGSAEVVLGQVLPKVRDEVVIVSKAGIYPWSMRGWTRVRTRAALMARSTGVGRKLVAAPPPARERYGMFSPRHLERSVERSLKALRTDHLDVFLLHECSVPEALAEETSLFLERLRRQGKARYVGLATGFAATVEAVATAPCRFAAAQFPSDAFDRNAEAVRQTWDGLVVTHSSLKTALPRLAARLSTDETKRRWTARAGLGVDTASLARVLLADALAANPDGMVLFTTSRPERMAAAVQATAVAKEALSALRDVIDRPSRSPGQESVFTRRGGGAEATAPSP